MNCEVISQSIWFAKTNLSESLKSQRDFIVYKNYTNI